MATRAHDVTGGARAMTRRLRIFALAFALLQIGLQGAFAIGDGYAERASEQFAAVHAESPWHTHHRAHGDDCAVCHVLATSSNVPRRPTPIWLDATRTGADPSPVLDARPDAPVEGARLARAPPSTV